MSWILKLYDNNLDDNFFLLNLLHRVLSGLSFWSLSLCVFRFLELFLVVLGGPANTLIVTNPFVSFLTFFWSTTKKMMTDDLSQKHLKFSTDIGYCVCA